MLAFRRNFYLDFFSKLWIQVLRIMNSCFIKKILKFILSLFYSHSCFVVLHSHLLYFHLSFNPISIQFMNCCFEIIRFTSFVLNSFIPETVVICEDQNYVTAACFVCYTLHTTILILWLFACNTFKYYLSCKSAFVA